MSGTKIRTLALILIPIVFSGVLTTWVNVSSSQANLEARASQYADAIADQLAMTITDPIVQRDLLSLNVVLNELLSRGNFQFASVYSSDNRLLAQAGRNEADVAVFTRDVVFQNASVGYVQLGLDQSTLVSVSNRTIIVSVLVHLVIICLIVVAVWIYGDFLYLWWSTPAAATRQGKDDEPVSLGEGEDGIEDISGDLTILVIKIRPARQLEANLDKVRSALSLYRGDVEITGGDDIIVTFSSHDQVFQAVCCGLLVRKIMGMAKGTNHVKLGMHVASLAEGDDVAKARKHATYLASISEDKLLTSRKVANKAGQSERMTLQAYHSSLTPDGEVYFLESLNPANDELISRQAHQFF